MGHGDALLGRVSGAINSAVLPLANNFLSADESLRMSFCRREFSGASLVDIMVMRKTLTYIDTTSFPLKQLLDSIFLGREAVLAAATT